MRLVDLKSYADLLSIIGAVIVFFSWVISNSLQQRYQAAKSSVERARSERRLYEELTEARRSIDSLGGEVINIRSELCDFRHEPAASTLEAEESYRLKRERDQILLSVASTRINARQIDWGTRFCANELELSRILPSKSDSVRKLDLACAAIMDLYATKNEILKNIDDLIGPSAVIDKNTEEQLSHLNRRYRELLPRFGPALGGAAQASNILQSEVAIRLRYLKRRAELISWIAFVTYVAGTALAVFGRVLIAG